MYREKDLSNLTPREDEILRLIHKGYTNKQISGELGISVQTVKTHIQHILSKLGLRSRYEIY